MRLDKLLANIGYGSRKEVKQLVKDKVVSVDGVTAKSTSQHVDPAAQEVMVFGEVVEYREFIYVMLHKPPGVISTRCYSTLHRFL